MEPAVGIFWFVLDSAGLRHMLADGCGLAEAAPYADCLTFDPGHDDVWTRWRRTGPPNCALAATVREDEYDEWPRGRIVFDRAADRFKLYADRRITAAGLTDEISRHFHLPADRVVVLHDLHYRSSRSIKSSA